MSVPKLQAILLDLDHTLYSPQEGLLREADRRITEFIRRRLGLPWDRADELRVRLWKEYGTTARGLAVEYGIAEEDVVTEALGQIDPTAHVSANDRLSEALSEIPVPLYLFTNAPRAYALRALRALGVEHLFVDIFDIEFLEWEGKPSEKAFKRVLTVLGCPASAVALGDDNPENLATARRLGMVTIAVHVVTDADIVLTDICQLPQALRRHGMI